MDTTGKAFVEHWSYASEKGLMKANTANSLQAAVRQILSVEDGWEDLDVTQIDVESLYKRFVNLKGKKYGPDSLATYKRRFQQALTMFKEYVNDPGNWKPTTRERKAPLKGNGNSSTETATATTTSRTSTPAVVESGLVDFPYPLRDGRVARLRLPADLKMKDVHRMYAFMKTLAEDFEPEA